MGEVSRNNPFVGELLEAIEVLRVRAFAYRGDMPGAAQDGGRGVLCPVVEHVEIPAGAVMVNNRWALSASFLLPGGEAIKAIAVSPQMAKAKMYRDVLSMLETGERHFPKVAPLDWHWVQTRQLGINAQESIERIVFFPDQLSTLKKVGLEGRPGRAMYIAGPGQFEVCLAKALIKQQV